MAKRTRWVLTVSSGILAALPWWGAPGALLLVCFLPLLLIEESLERDGLGVLGVLPYSFIFFLTWNLVATWWIARIHFAGGVSVIMLNSIIMCLVFLLYSRIRRTTGQGAAVLVILWMGFEFLHHRGDLSWPWLSLGNGLASGIRIIQWYEYTGSSGGSLWIMVVNAMLFGTIRHLAVNRNFRTLFPRIIMLLLTVVIPPSISLNLLRSNHENSGQTGFLILQTDLDPYEVKYSGISNNQRLEMLLELAGKNMEQGVSYIVSPETSLDSIWLSDPDDKLIEKVSGFMEKHPGRGMILGATTFKTVPDSARSFVTRRGEDGKFFDVYNSALLFFPGRPLVKYHKYYLANGVEQIPFQRIFGFARRMSVNLGGVTGSLKRGPGPRVIAPLADDLPAIGILICFESAYGEYSASMVRLGAELLVVMTNDGWFRNTGGYRQHLRLSRIRAVESRRSIVRSANSGISCHISQSGKITDRLEWQEEGALLVMADRNKRITFFTSSGDYIGRIALFLSGLLVLNFFVRKLIS
jgi:apolipoprotein N-acyltransferase